MNTGMVVFVGSGGLLVMIVIGNIVSRVHENCAGVTSWLPALSVARTLIACGPSPDTVVVNGGVHAANAPLSIWHSNVEPACDRKSNVGVVSFVGFGGV